MRKLSLVFLSAFVFSSTALLQSGYTAANMTSGQVMKVDESAGKITLKHGPMKKFNMEEGMTMVYLVQDPSVLNQVKVGDKVRFDAAADCAENVCCGLCRERSTGTVLANDRSQDSCAGGQLR